MPSSTLLGTGLAADRFMNDFSLSRINPGLEELRGAKALVDLGWPGQAIDSPIPSDTESVSHAIDVVEPRSNQRDLQNPAVIEACRPQALMVVG